MRASALRQPRQQGLQASCGCLEGPAFPRSLPASNNAHTANDRLLVNIEAGDTLMHDFHLRSPSAAASVGISSKRTLKNVLQEHCCSLAPVGVIEVPRVQLTNGLVRTIDKPTSLPTASPEYPSGDAKRFHPGRVGCKAGGELSTDFHSVESKPPSWNVREMLSLRIGPAGSPDENSTLGTSRF